MATTESRAFGALLRRHRMAADLTQETLAERAGLSVRAISDLERGVHRAPYQATVERLIEALDLSPDEGAALGAIISRRRSTEPRSRMPQLPAHPTLLIGREQDEAAIIHLIRWEGRRLVTLTGTGGVGKTRLALQVAKSIAADFADGAVFVPLASVTDPGMVLPLLSTTLGAPRQAGQPVLQTLVSHLQDREVLLLLDNIEHVVAMAPLLAELLAVCPRVKMLVTSRASLHLAGEQGVEVTPLPVPHADAALSPTALQRYPSVALLLDRARLIVPELTLTPANSVAIGGICRRVEGLPLAIELAAARLKILSPQALLARLDHRLTMLTGGTREVAARHQTMRNTIAWSYELLDAGEQYLFRCLSVFGGGCDADAAEAVCAGNGVESDVFDTLTSLVDKSLLLIEDREADEPRFIMLETIREFALEQLEVVGEEAAARKRHARFFLALTQQAEPELRGRDQAKWLGRLEREHDNFRTVLRWSGASHEVETGLRLASVLWWLWHTHGYLTEGRRWLEQVLELDAGRNHAGSSVFRAKALRGAGTLAAEQGDYGPATVYAEESLGIFRRLGDRQGVGTLLTILGSLAQFQANFAQAGVLYGEALALFRELGATQSVSVALNNLASVAKEQAKYTEALALYGESLVIKREIGDRRGVAIVLSNIGTMAHQQGEYQQAVVAGEESVAILRELEDKSLAAALDTLARAVLALGQEPRATSLYREALTIARAAGEKRLMALFLEGAGGCASVRGDAMRAAQLYGASAALREDIVTPLSPAEEADYASYIEAARRDLGEDAFAAAWESGKAMTLDDAVAAALTG